jgi:hypothetical protein
VFPSALNIYYSDQTHFLFTQKPVQESLFVIYQLQNILSPESLKFYMTDKLNKGSTQTCQPDIYKFEQVQNVRLQLKWCYNIRSVQDTKIRTRLSYFIRTFNLPNNPINRSLHLSLSGPIIDQ